jgi:hypothetical protein
VGLKVLECTISEGQIGGLIPRNLRFEVGYLQTNQNLISSEQFIKSSNVCGPAIHA